MKNSHGDIIGQVDEYGNLLNSYAYNAFGELVAAVTIQPEKTKNTSRFLYAGEQYDETSGLYYLRARCYDADAGRFTQEDTYLGDGRNLYAYTHSNPLKYVDPSGHFVADCYDNDGDLANDWQEDVSGGANTGYGRTGALSNGRISGGGSKYQVGAYQNIKGTTGLDAHHVGQKAAMKQLVGSYNVKTAPAINVPKVGHTISGPNGIISRSTLGITNARQLLARDLFELKRVYPDIPNSAYQELINMNMNMYPEMRK